MRELVAGQPGIWAERLTAAPPAEELDAVLVRLTDRLTSVTDGECASADRAGDLDPCLRELRRFVSDDLTPIVHALQLRVHPALRAFGLRSTSWQAAVEYARLLRLADQVAALQARLDVDGSSPGLRAQVRALLVELSAVASEHLAREREVVSHLLRRLPDGEAARVVSAAHRTAHASARESRHDLDPALL